MRRKEALFAVIGGVVGAILTMVVGSFSPLGAQSQSDVSFGKITCKELVVENPDGMDAVWIFPSIISGVIAVYGKDKKIMAGIGANGNGGRVDVYGKDDSTAAYMGVHEHGGRVSVYGKDGGIVKIGVDEDGGRVAVHGKDGGKAIMEVGEDGESVAVLGKDGKSSASMWTSEKYGGMVGETDKNGVTTLLNPDW